MEYGRGESYEQNAGDFKYSLSHSIVLKGLVMGTEYKFRVGAVDKTGNTKFSDPERFTTKYFTEAVGAAPKAENIYQFQQEIESAIESALPSLVPPFIEEPRVTDITEDSATIRWRTNVPAFSSVSYAPEENYDPERANPYTGEASNITSKIKEHEIKLSNLQSNTRYHLIARSFSLPQAVGKSSDINFITKAAKIEARVVNVKKDGFLVVWTTQEPTDSVMEYKNLTTGETNRKRDAKMISFHEVSVENLPSGVTYEVKVYGYNEKGNLIESEKTLRVTTSRDTTPPQITSFRVESVLVTQRADNKAQAIVGWVTDEPANSLIYYEEGPGTGEELKNKVEELGNYVTAHVLLVPNLLPGSIYRIRIGSTDEAGNSVLTPVRTIIMPRQAESVFDVIFKNFEETFKFLRRVP